ncbi:Pr6Pr family membrane protein [Mucilaginibacter sp. OK098]|uniref:Pr6Pr family membrane protein n=1 Tax=Mucilaginibacter sp. OK098 TaxID=1855297 RepID=UPI000914B4A4|nr:Pr6Pr family membrane protein [Mucilaginibacter sp. OK098]SHN10587.1 hypothetical protein SAMN05216524_105242 [Mucilaginibacter sp. OK098]
MENTADLQQASKIKWAYTALVIIVTWFALVLQFSISIPAYLAAGRSLCSTLVQLYSYYTILSNLLMVVCLTIILIAPTSALGHFFLKRTVLTSIALYITIVALIYNIVLRNLWHMEGLFKLANELLHVVNPILFIIYWFAFVPKAGLKYRDVLPWLWFPLIYFIYVLIRGAISGDYPYPFLNAEKSGYAQVMLNALILLPVIWGLGALYVLIARLMSRSEK